MPATSEDLKRLAAHRRLVGAAAERGLDNDLPVLAIEARLVEGYDVNSDDVLLNRSVILRPRPHPILEALLELRGATRTGQMTWTVGFGENYTDAPYRVLVNNVRRGLVWPEKLMSTTRGARDLSEYDRAYNKPNELRSTADRTAAEHFIAANAQAFNAAHPGGAHGYGAIGLSFTPRVGYIKLFTHQLRVPAHLPQVNLDLRPADDKAARDPQPILPTHAIEVLEWLQSEGVLVVDPDETGPIAALRKRIASAVIAYPTPGKPALAEVSVGRAVRALVDLGTPAPGENQAATRGQIPAQDVEAALRAAPLVAGAIHPGTKDAGRLALAEPFDDERLRPYQRVAVGRHLSTDIGYLNASSPGLGKTVMCLTGMRQRSLSTTKYRGLIVVEANVRHQWGPEAAKWFPEARVITVKSSADGERLNAELDACGDNPAVVIMSYAMLKGVHNEVIGREADAAAGRRRPVRRVLAPLNGRNLGQAADEPEQMELFHVELPATEGEAVQLVEAIEVEEEITAPVSLGALLLDTHWHDLIADEAEVLRSTGSKQGTALWALRANSDVAVALTGTPINRGIDDLGRLVSWCRNDAHLFRGVKLSEQFDLSSDSELERLRQAMGGVMFRADTSEVSDEVPKVKAVIMKLKPTAAEKALADAARMELKRVYDELLEAIELAEATDPENGEYAEARDQLRAARGAHLGGTTLARMASSDPAALLGSTSAGAALLSGQGLIAAATQQTGTKRAAVVADTVERVTNGEAVLIFTEFATVATGLIEDLENAGVKVGAVLGGGGKKRDIMVQDFTAGDLDVLVATSAGERGLNLQRASTVVHYDLPWAPKGVLQRTGRALRLESKNQSVTLVFPLMEGTVEERVAATVVRRALEAMYALDKSRGVDISKTEIGLALGGLAATIADTAEGRAHGDQLLDITRQLVGA